MKVIVASENARREEKSFLFSLKMVKTILTMKHMKKGLTRGELSLGNDCVFIIYIQSFESYHLHYI